MTIIIKEESHAYELLVSLDKKFAVKQIKGHKINDELFNYLSALYLSKIQMHIQFVVHK